MQFEIENQAGSVAGPTWGAATFDYLYLVTGFPSDTWHGYDIPTDLDHRIDSDVTMYFRDGRTANDDRGALIGHLSQIRRVPEPSTLLLVGVGCAAALRLRRPRH
jgi:hypothetical protein